MAGGFQFHRQPMQNAWGGSNNNGQFNNNNQSNQGNQYPNQGGNFHNGPPPGNYNFNGQHPGHHMGFSQAPSFNSYGKSDGPMDPPRGQQNPAGGRQGQGPPGQPPRLFSPPPSGQPGSRPGSSSGPSGQPPRVFSPGPSQGPPRVFSPGPSQGQPLRVFSPGPESGPHGQQRVNPFPQGMGYDPARLQAGPSSWITNRRVDLPGAAYAAGEGVSLLLISFSLPP
ncbi:hypothetical protein GLAREA_11030 [Glarea lozoyensis ATCC 20868]|uniref:Uncharacterized protein n=1 Tax=Glarea lozoyensis (strain ATCC 20868 / MF5171) TaxID=1116229 RepID=S3DTS7_GLAL2|nr:uncharacterized protein GLAREA_11030 [Glarea lozoyensis ATCC 20868]EPE35331.1 hypothetical protein GLAREA_11030 [Glarea lozoyensis ATCC 20868]